VRWKWKPEYCNPQKVKKSTKPTHCKKLVLRNTDPGVLAWRFEDGRVYPVPQQAAMQHVSRIQRQPQAHCAASSFLNLSSKQSLCGDDVFLELFIVFSRQPASAEKCPEVRASDITRSRFRAPYFPFGPTASCRRSSSGPCRKCSCSLQM
jgi:hypothetical protein